ncbi:pyruvate kinase [Muricoccus aerilatus]|uniref:pyruvate kinase n=1 Tax=Muricoccus aerilatus TaxID=452982 RepID=UPI001FE0751F|nr:pyruvate kinase [Roseomonas aerilata]
MDQTETAACPVKEERGSAARPAYRMGEAAQVPVIWATQVLEHLVKKGTPSREEMTDAAMVARAECVMLNKGPHVFEAVHELETLLRHMTEHQHKKTPQLRRLASW